MSRKTKRQQFDIPETEVADKRRRPRSPDQTLKLYLKTVNPLTENQRRTFDSYYSGQNLLLMGSAGTGKSFLSLYLGLNDLLKEDSEFKKLIIIRSAVPSRDIGFLPGTQKEKMKVYELPYKQIFNELLGRGDAYDILRNKGIVEFECTSFLRGITFNDALIIVDECQNNSWGELVTLITRVGENCRIIFSGDYFQSDLNPKHQRDTSKGDILKFQKVIESMSMFDVIGFTHEDIVRSKLVKEFIIKSDMISNDYN